MDAKYIPYVRCKSLPTKVTAGFKGGKMTYKDIYYRCKETIRTGYIEDYRPNDQVFTEPLKDKTGIVVWFKNGDEIVYYPKVESEESPAHSADKKYPDKYVVLLELETGYIECVSICDNPREAYGTAYLAATNDIDDSDNYYVTPPSKREGENGYMFEVRRKSDDDLYSIATVLFYRKEEMAENNDSSIKY